MQSLLSNLDQLKEHKIFRALTLRQGLVDFSSNDYLGLSCHPAIRSALVKALDHGIPLGATGSRLLSGNLEFHEELEAFLAERFHSKSALLFSSGYLANMAILSSLGTEDAEFFSDELNHASLIDGMRLSKAKRTIFRHNDITELRKKLKASKSPRKIVVTESLFSMDGDLAPLEQIAKVVEEFDAWLVVDEAHATGVFGKDGLGRLQGIDVPVEKLISIHTCGKALGSQGAFILSSRSVRDYLINVARQFIFTTAISPLLCVQIRTAVELLPSLNAERKHLHGLSNLLRDVLRDQIDIGKSESQIVPIILGSNERVLRLSRLLQAKGLDVRAIRSPTVPPGRERLRVSLSSSLRNEDVLRLTDAIREVGNL